MSHRCRRAGALLFLVLALATVSACTSNTRALDATAWRLTGWTISSLDPADFTITIEFAEGRLSGFGAVNSYSGTYKTGPGNAFAAGPTSTTLIAGPEPAMRAESAYFELLGQAGSYEVTDRDLTLFDSNGNESLLFEAIVK